MFFDAMDKMDTQLKWIHNHNEQQIFDIGNRAAIFLFSLILETLAFSSSFHDPMENAVLHARHPHSHEDLSMGP